MYIYIYIYICICTGGGVLGIPGGVYILCRFWLWFVVHWIDSLFAKVSGVGMNFSFVTQEMYIILLYRAVTYISYYILYIMDVVSCCLLHVN
jgi:hypothetical protein